MSLPLGRLTDEGQVLVEEQAEANRLFNKGFAGVPQKGGALRLTLIEACQLVEDERLRVEDDIGQPLALAALLERGVANDETFEIPFFAYRDLRARGYVTKFANRRSLDFLVYERGSAPPRAKPTMLAGACSERAAIGVQDLTRWLAEAEAEETRLVLLVVDEEGDLTHYHVHPITPSGKAQRPALKAVAGRFLQGRVFVWDAAAADALRGGGFIGRRVAKGLHLSLVEAAALVDEGCLDVPEFWASAESVQPDLRLRLAAYQDLAGRGLWVKTGFKFGTHFRVYDDDPREQHAPWLAHAVGTDWTTTWPELSRAVRLAHSVRKTFVLSIVDAEGGPLHLAVERFKP